MVSGIKFKSNTVSGVKSNPDKIKVGRIKPKPNKIKVGGIKFKPNKIIGW